MNAISVKERPIADNDKNTTMATDSGAHAGDAAYAGQILDGAKMIGRYLVHLGFSDMTEKKVFYWAANGQLPVKKIGSRIISTKQALIRHFGLLND